ncbi:hypothetical protein STEG23_017724 [Scotinomys teguina]
MESTTWNQYLTASVTKNYWSFKNSKPSPPEHPLKRRTCPRTPPGAASHPGKKRTQEQPVTLRGRGLRSSQSPSEDEPQSLPETQEQPVTLRGRGPRNSQSITLRGRGPRSSQSSLEEDQGTTSHPWRKRIQEHPDTIGTRDFP